VIAAIDFCIANKYKLKIDIINLSLGHPIYEPAVTDPLVQACRTCRTGRNGGHCLSGKLWVESSDRTDWIRRYHIAW
jgi:hypothetical protein